MDQSAHRVPGTPHQTPFQPVPTVAAVLNARLPVAAPTRNDSTRQASITRNVVLRCDSRVSPEVRSACRLTTLEATFDDGRWLLLT
jgi:hypothetical protein